MSKVLEFIAEEHFPIEREITKKRYEKARSELSDSEFTKKYSLSNEKHGDNIFYYERIFCPPKEAEVNILLISKLLEQQTIATKKLSTIAGIMVFALIISIIAAIITLVNLY